MQGNRLRQGLSLVCITVLLLFSMTACTGGHVNTGEETTKETQKVESTTEAREDHVPTQDEKNETVVLPLNESATFVKLLDERMLRTSQGITCDWSCAGIELVADCEGEITFAVSLDRGSGCYFRAFVDGKEWKNGESDYYACTSARSVIRLQNIPQGTHTVRLVKVTGYTLANTTLQSMTLKGSVSETAPKKQDRYIEYIGDSMFCGWGVVGTYDGKYTSQDGTLAIPYLVSEALGADFSVAAVSGQGAVFGTPNVENAYRYASYQRGMTEEFGFARKADAVVINLGTNDYSNQGEAPADRFAAAYERILRYVRRQHGESCAVIAVYNVMNDTYAQQILQVLQALGGEKQGFYAVKLDRTARVYTSHPTAEENAAYAKVLREILTQILDGSYPTTDGLDWFEYEVPALQNGLTVVEDMGMGKEVHNVR